MAEPLGGTLTLEPGDFAWALGKGQLWWPARVRTPSAKAKDPPDSYSHSHSHSHSHSQSPSALYLSCFGDGGSAWHDHTSATLASFSPSSFRSFASRVPPSSRALARALSAAAAAFARCLEAHLTCPCVPAEALAAAKFRANDGASPSPVSVANAVPEEIVRGVREFAVDVSAGTALDAAVARAWVAAFARGTGLRYAPLPEFGVYRGIPQEKSSLRACREEDDEEGKTKRKMKAKQRSMAELIAGLDLEVGGEDVEEGWEVGPGVKRREEEEDGVGSGRRERKKSKYLSPPYMLVNLKVKRAVGAKGFEKKTGGENSEGGVAVDVEEGASEKASRSRQRVHVCWDENDFMLDEKTVPVGELLMKLRLVAVDVMYLEGSQFDHGVRGFFGRYRRMVYRDEVETNDAKSKADMSGVGVRTLGIEKVLEGRETPVEGKSGKEKKRKLPAVENGSVRAKRKGYMKKKSIGGIIGSGVQEPKLSGGERAMSSKEEANGLGGDKPVQKRKGKKKDGVSGGKDDPQGAGAIQEANLAGGGESMKKRNKKKKEETNNNEEVTPIGNGGIEANGSKGGKSEKKSKGKKMEQPDTVNAGPKEGKSNKKTSRKRKELVNGDFGGAIAVPVILEANGKEKEQVTTDVGTGLATNGPEEGTSMKKTNRKKKVAANVETGDANGEGKPKQKRQRRKKEEANASDGAVLVGSAVQGASGEGGEPKHKKNRKKKDEVNHDKGAALLLSFSKGVELPSKEELISTYSKYGTLRKSETALMKDSSSATVVFTKKSDAEKAFNCPDRDRAFGSNIAACQIQCFSGDSSTLALSPSTPKPPLEFVKKSLESMITTLTASGVPVRDFLGSDGGLRLDSKENLVDEMSGLLKKVNSLLTAGPSSAGGGSTSGTAT